MCETTPSAQFKLFLTEITIVTKIKASTNPKSVISLTFFHHILLFKPLLRTRNSRALPPSRSVLSTRRSMRSPRSSNPSMLRVMIPRTSSISRCALVMASSRPWPVVPYSTIRPRRSLLKAPAP